MPSLRKECTSNPMTRQFKNIIILGAGAIGSFYGSQLSGNNEVLFIGRKPHVDVINRHGLTVLGANAGIYNLRAVDNLDHIPEATLLICSMKASALTNSIQQVQGLIQPDTVVLLLQNGLGNEDICNRYLPPEMEIVRGLSLFGVQTVEPGVVEVMFVGLTVIPDSRTGRHVKELFESSGLSVRLSGDMDYEIWMKLVLNCVINPLTAIYRVPNNSIVNEFLKPVIAAIIDECKTVADAEGVRLPDNMLDTVYNAASDYSNYSSMCQDIMRGRDTEIEFLNGKVVELGKKHGIPTPINNVITNMVRFMEGRKWT